MELQPGNFNENWIFIDTKKLKYEMLRLENLQLSILMLFMALPTGGVILLM